MTASEAFVFWIMKEIAPLFVFVALFVVGFIGLMIVGTINDIRRRK